MFWLSDSVGTLTGLRHIFTMMYNVQYFRPNKEHLTIVSQKKSSTTLYQKNISINPKQFFKMTQVYLIIIYSLLLYKKGSSYIIFWSWDNFFFQDNLFSLFFMIWIREYPGIKFVWLHDWNSKELWNNYEN